MSVHRLTIVGSLAALAILTAGVVFASTTQGQKDVRIAAQLLENGKVEFGLQERTDGGEWGSTLLPARNKFPYATATVDRWLYSSPVTLTPVASLPDGGIGPMGWWIDISSEADRGTFLQYLLIPVRGPGALWVGCDYEGNPFVGVRANIRLLNDSQTDRITVIYHVEGGNFETARWWSDETHDEDTPSKGSAIHSLEEERFVLWLVLNMRINATFHFSATDRYRETYAATFDLTGLHTVLDQLPCYTRGG